MDDPVAIALAAAAQSGATGTILYLGAGSGQKLAGLMASDAARIVLVEPNPEMVAQLEAFAAGDTRIRVVASALAAEDGQAVLRIFNLKSLSSLRAPQDLTGLFPGLRDVAATSVTTVTLDSLLSQIPPADSGVGDILIIDAPGEEATAVAALLARPDKERFAAVLLSCGKTAHYEGGASIGALRGRLQSAGYRLETTDQTDPDRPRMVLLIDQVAREATRMKARLAELTTALAEATTALAESATVLAERDAEVAKVLQDRDLQFALAEARKTLITALEQRVRELEQKQQIARTELRRSEGQIDLIKDLLLREGSP